MAENHTAAMLSRIEKRLEAVRLSERAASERAVNQPDMIRDIRRGRRPGAERLAKLADVLETTPDYLLGRSEEPDATATNARIVSLDSVQPVNSRSLSKDLPIYGTALGSDLVFEEPGGSEVAIEQTTVDMAGPIDFIRRPPGLAGNRQAYGVIVSGESMFPRFQNGETLLVDPRRPPSIGNDVVVQLRSPESGNDRVVKVIVKTLKRRTAHYLELEQYNPALSFKVPMEQVAAIHRIAPWGEMMSV